MPVEPETTPAEPVEKEAGSAVAPVTPAESASKYLSATQESAGPPSRAVGSRVSPAARDAAPSPPRAAPAGRTQADADGYPTLAAMGRMSTKNIVTELDTQDDTAEHCNKLFDLVRTIKPAIEPSVLPPDAAPVAPPARLHFIPWGAGG